MPRTPALSGPGPARPGPARHTPARRRPAAVTLALLLAGATASAARAEPPRVVADIPATGALVAEVMGDLGRPEVLAGAGADPHHFQLRPSQARALAQADLLFWVGPELTPWLVGPAATLGQGQAVALLALPGTARSDYPADGGTEEGGDHDQDHAHDRDSHDSHDRADGHASHDGHDDGDRHLGTDPHAWLDPDNGQLWLGGIADALAARDPEHAATYRANAARAKADLERLDAGLAARLAPARGKPFVVLHDAYGHFTRHYGLGPTYAVSLGDASAPSAARLRELRRTLGEAGAVCAFPETNHDPRLLASVLEGTGIRQGAALSPEGGPAEPRPGAYAAILTGLAETLLDCLAPEAAAAGAPAPAQP